MPRESLARETSLFTGLNRNCTVENQVYLKSGVNDEDKIFVVVSCIPAAVDS